MRDFFPLGVIGLLMSCTSSTPMEVDQAKLEELNNALKEDRIADVHAVLVDYRGDRIFEGYYEAPTKPMIRWGWFSPARLPQNRGASGITTVD